MLPTQDDLALIQAAPDSAEETTILSKSDSTSVASEPPPKKPTLLKKIRSKISRRKPSKADETLSQSTRSLGATASEAAPTRRSSISQTQPPPTISSSSVSISSMYSAQSAPIHKPPHPDLFRFVNRTDFGLPQDDENDTPDACAPEPATQIVVRGLKGLKRNLIGDPMTFVPRWKQAITPAGLHAASHSMDAVGCLRIEISETKLPEDAALIFSFEGQEKKLFRFFVGGGFFFGKVSRRRIFFNLKSQILQLILLCIFWLKKIPLNQNMILLMRHRHRRLELVKLFFLWRICFGSQRQVHIHFLDGLSFFLLYTACIERRAL
jgi:hypothetical protein